MSGKPAKIKQCDVERVIRAAKNHGATKVEVQIDEASVIIHLGDDKPVAPDEEITL